MPKQVVRSVLAGKISDRAKRALDEHRNDDIKMPGGGSDPPPGIENGVAKLVECKFAEYENGALKGQLYFRAVGVIRQPKDVNGIPCRNLRTTIMEPICDTPDRSSRKTQEDHLLWVQNELKKLGASPDDVAADNLETTVQALKDAGIYFRFRTFAFPKQTIEKVDGKWALCEDGKPTDKRYPTESAAKAANPFADGRDPRVIQTWLGRCEYQEEEDDDSTQDDSGSASAEEPAAEEPQEEETQEESSEEQEVSFGDNLDDLVAETKNKDKKVKSQAEAKLTQMATDAGCDADEVAKADSWEDVAKMIRDAQGGGGDSSEEEEFTPEVGSVYGYKPAGAKKSVEVEVLTVSEKTQTVTVKDCDTKKTILDKDKKPMRVKWSDLSVI